jgi:hypothetical protein
LNINNAIRLVGYYKSSYGYDKSSYDIVFDRIIKKIESIYPKYKEILIFKETEIVNNFKLYTIDCNPISIIEFIKAKKLYEKNKPISYKNFKKKFIKKTCGIDTWYKKDKNGKTYFDHDAYEKHCICLYELPYSTKLKLWSIGINIKRGYINYKECLRYSNFICHWVEWKVKQMDLHMKRVDKKLEINKIKGIIKNVAMEPSRIFNWYLDEEEKNMCRLSFDCSIREKRYLLDIIKEQEIFT